MTTVTQVFVPAQDTGCRAVYASCYEVLDSLASLSYRPVETQPETAQENMEKSIATKSQVQPATTAPTGTLLPDQQTLSTIEKLSDYVIESGEYQKRFRNRAQAVMVMLRGHNLGISFDAALDHVYVVQGKTGISGQLMLRLIYERVPNAIVDFDDSVDKSKICVVRMGRPGKKTQEFSFSIEEADAAGVTRNRDGSPNMVWKAYRQDMLRWRAVARGARVVFPDAIQGCWLQSELAEIRTAEPPPESIQPQVVQVEADDVEESSSESDRDRLKRLLKQYNHTHGVRLSYRKAAEELIGVIVKQGEDLEPEHVHMLCDFLSGTMEA